MQYAPRSNKAAKSNFWTKEADKALKDGLSSGEIDAGLTAPDAFQLHPAFQEAGLDVFRRHFYSERKAFTDGILVHILLYSDNNCGHRYIVRPPLPWVTCTACSFLLKLKFPKILKYKRTSVCYAMQFPSSGLLFSVDFSLLFHAKLLVFSAIQLRLEDVWLLNEGARLYTKLLLRDYSVLAITMRKIALWTAYLKSKIRQKYCYYISDGTVIYLVTPLWVRLLSTFAVVEAMDRTVLSPRYCLTAKILEFFHIPGEENPADIVSKHWSHNKIWHVLQPLLFWKGDTLQCRTTR